MISGRISASLEASIPLLVSGPDGQSLQVDAIVDTGFSGSLTLPLSVIESIGLTWLCRQQGMLADGRIHPFDVYTANIVWDNSERTIEVEAADVDPLLGMSLLAGYRVTMEVRASGNMTIESLE